VSRQGVIAMKYGALPTLIRSNAVLVAVLIKVTWFPPLLAT